jgi:hypothetical protein
MRPLGEEVQKGGEPAPTYPSGLRSGWLAPDHNVWPLPEGT